MLLRCESLEPPISLLGQTWPRGGMSALVCLTPKLRTLVARRRHGSFVP